MNRFLVISMCTISMFCFCLTQSFASNEIKPFVGRWGFWEQNCYYEFEIDLYQASSDGTYGYYNDTCDDTSLTYRITDIVSIQNNIAEIMMKGDWQNKKEKARLKYDHITGNLTLEHPDFSMPFIVKPQDKYGYVINIGNNTNVRTSPISGAPILKAARGRSFKFLGKEKGWFKIEISDTNKQTGYISPQYARYLKDNNIPDNVFGKSYQNDNIMFELQKEGKQIKMYEETTFPRADGTFSPASYITYIGKINGNAIIFEYSYNEIFNNTEIEKIKPYIIYYDKESDMFIINGENFIPDSTY